MPRIFDNIEQSLLPALTQTLAVSTHADFCVGYFNLRGWKQLDGCIEQWPGGDGHCCCDFDKVHDEFPLLSWHVACERLWHIRNPRQQ